nr:immunity 26/phosphotriesterase HocA family protein [Streptomyces canus]
MPVKYRLNDVFFIPVADGTPAAGRIILQIRGGNILVTVYPEHSQIVENADLERLSVSRPVFTVETMDLFIKNGKWPVLGNWTPLVESQIPVYKTQFEPGGPYFEQRIDGIVGGQLADEEAIHLKRQKSFSPALVEKAVRAFQGLDPWIPVFDEMRSDEAT